MDIPSERVEKVKDSMRELFEENGNKPLSAVELLRLVRKKLSNGETVDEGAIGKALEQMLSRHEFSSDTTGKVPKFNLKSSTKPR